MLATVDENITSSQELILRSFNPLLWITQQGSVSKTILAENVAVVQKILVITKLSYEKTTLMLKLFRVFSLSSAVVMLIWAMKNFISWFNSWLLLHPDSKATLSPPPTSARTSSKLNIVVRFSICLSLLLAAISNFFHFLLTAEILSVVFFNHRAISFPVAQTIGWVAINLDAAIQGNVSKSTVGIALLIAFTLPTMIIMLTWICFLVSQVIKVFETEPTEQKNKCGLTPKNCTSIN